MAHGPTTKRQNNTQINDNFDNDDDLQQQIPVPPDGGWGWMVSFASFMIHIVTDGITYSFGMFYVEFLDYFHEGKGYTAWIVSILVGVTLCSGPISSAFVNRYGCRPVTIAGSLLAGFCIVISIFATNVLTLIFTIGIGAGFGFGLIYLPAIVSVTMYFEKYRSLATGIAVCGSGLGTFIFAPLTETLIGHFGWRGAMLIIGAIVFNCIIFGAMFRPLEVAKPKRQQNHNNNNNINKNFIQHSSNNELQPLNSNKLDQRNTLVNDKNDVDIPMTRSYSIGFEMINILKNHSNNANNTNGHITNGGTLPLKDIKRDNLIRATVSQPHIFLDGNRHMNETKMMSASGTMYRPDILYQGSLVNIPQYRSRGELRNYGQPIGKEHPIDQNRKIKKLFGCIPCSKETHDIFSEMMNFSLFNDVIFVIFTFSNFCTSIGFNIPYVYLAAQADILELSKGEASWLLSAIGIANTVGRIVLGYISDKPWVNRLLVYNVCLTVCGIATALSIYCNGFVSLLIYASVFGFTIGAYVGLTSVILVDLLGLDKLTNAFGLLLLFQGIASLVGPPLAGWLYDITISYKPGFLLAGGAIAFSGLILFSIPPIQRYLAKRNQHNIELEQL